MNTVTINIEMDSNFLFLYEQFLNDEVRRMNEDGCQLLDNKFNIIKEVSEVHQRIVNPNTDGLFGPVRVKAIPRLKEENKERVEMLRSIDSQLDRTRFIISILIDLINQIGMQVNKSLDSQYMAKTEKGIIGLWKRPFEEEENRHKKFRDDNPNLYLSDKEIQLYY
jgi:hypothetical protein